MQPQVCARHSKRVAHAEPGCPLETEPPPPPLAAPPPPPPPPTEPVLPVQPPKLAHPSLQVAEIEAHCPLRHVRELTGVAVQAQTQYRYTQSLAVEQVELLAEPPPPPPVLRKPPPPPVPPSGAAPQDRAETHRRAKQVRVGGLMDMTP